MTVAEQDPILLHADAGLFREAVSFTAAETGFALRLIEKDYFCTVLLQHLAAAMSELIFKGGTCLAKVHAGFYRMSQDLDFAIPMPISATRSARSRRAAGLKEAVSRIDRHVSAFRVVTALRGASNSTQYNATLGYTSLLGRQEETIRIEVSLRESLLEPSVQGAAQTILLDPISGSPLVPVLIVPCISRDEALAEKLRAALSRREVAIRDFYDVDHAVRRLGLRPEGSRCVELVRRKLTVAGNDPVDVSAARLAALRTQLESELKPVLRPRDFAKFDLERAFATVARVAAALA